jgi:uncharacterized membrane protein YdjX (TVP38/TMEM64 family)
MAPREALTRWYRQRHLWHRVVVTALATVGLVAIVSSDALHAALLELYHLADQAIGRHPVAGPVAFVLFAAASAMLAFVASALLVPAALVAWGPGVTFALLWLGWILGGAVSYAFARSLGRRALALLGSGAPLARWEERISARAPFGLVLLFQLAVPSEVPGYVLGLARYPFWRYLAVVAIGELPFAVGTVFLGDSFLARRTAMVVALGVLLIVISLLIVRAFHRRLR